MEKALGCPVAVVNDVEIVLPCINASNGIAAIAGTGSSYYGVRNEKTAKAGGLSATLSDEGSAYDIAVNVLRAAVRSWDGRGEKTLLENMIFSRTGAKEHVTGITAIIRRLGFDAAFDVALTGRLFSKNVLTARVREALDKTAPRAKIRVVKEPAIGASKLAMQLYKQSRKKP